MEKNILYIHGFNSSPLSEKAQLTQQYFKENHPTWNFHAPQLINHPQAAIDQLTNIVLTDQLKPWVVMGSSLGGYFSTYLAEKFKLPAVLINPAVKPYELMSDFLGPQQNPYTLEKFEIEATFIDQLKLIEQHKLNDPKQYFVMVQTGDEVLNYQLAVNKYQDSSLEIQTGGNHSFVDYDQMLPKIAKFIQLF